MTERLLAHNSGSDAALCAGCALIIGLGNPGTEYAAHRHNIGFQVVDALARKHGIRFFRHKRALAYVARGRIGRRTVLLAKPQTFMNLSGKAASRLCRIYDLPAEEVLVIYDDLDLPLGRLRLRPEGGAGGHRGMRSIIDRLGTQAFPRLRVGIDRPAGRLDPADYVLQPFSKSQTPLVTHAVAMAIAAVECWLHAGIVTAMDHYNRSDLDGGNGESSEGCQGNRA